MKLSTFRRVAVLAMALLVFPLAGCAAEEAAPPPPPPPPPPAGTITVEPVQINYATLEAMWPAVAQAMGIPEAAVPVLPASLAVLGIPINFAGSGWPANDLVTIELVLPAGVTAPGLEPGTDSIGITYATANAGGNFEVTLDGASKFNWLLRIGWTPNITPDMATIDPLPASVYTIRAVGAHPETVATTTWDLELVAPAAAEEPATD